MYQTALPHIYAVGDVIGYPGAWPPPRTIRAHCGRALVKGEASAHLIEDIPPGFTIPEIPARSAKPSSS